MRHAGRVPDPQLANVSMNTNDVVPTIAAELMRELIASAVLAPSSHNTQPWLFVAGRDYIDVIADRRRALPVNDPHDRELTISCACALFNLRVAAAHAKLCAEVSLLPEGSSADLLARLRLSRTDKSPPEAALHAAVAARRTVRERFQATPVDDEAMVALARAAESEGAMLDVIAFPPQRYALAELVAEGDRLLWAQASWRRELAAWMHPRRSGDGLSMPALAVPVAQAVVRTFDMGHGVAAKDRQLADESPLLAVLATEGDTTTDWLVAGQALQRSLLSGVQLGLQASYLNQPVQMAATREKLRARIGIRGVPQLVLRWGRPVNAVSASPRRPVAEVLELVT